jgi:cyclophilin family peptidyl-prolyl cis-trans isomerase
MIATRKLQAILTVTLSSLSLLCLYAQPSIDAIPNLTVPAGKSVVIPIFGATTNHWKLTYTAQSSLPEAVTARVHQDNPWLKLSVRNFGDMTFMLFRDQTPATVKFIADLADTSFYDGLKFHRVVSDFVIQTGDPLGDGSGGPDFSFSDEFNPTLIFSGNGQLAMANGGKDSNGSQIFVTIGPQRELDFNHTIFGQLVRGFDVLGKIAVTPTTNEVPMAPIVISQAGTVTNYADTVITLLGSSQVNATATITLTANDGHGGQFVRSFDVRVIPDSVNDPVILMSITNLITPINTPLKLPIGAIDLENDPIDYAAQLIAGSSNYATLTLSSNLLTITPRGGYQGPLYCLLGAREKNATSRGSTINPFDIDFITIGVGASPLTAVPTNIVAVPTSPLFNRAVAYFTAAPRAPTNFSANIIWGDFRATDADILQLAPGNYVAIGSHTYLSPGEFRISVDIADNFGATAHVESLAIVRPLLSLAQGLDPVTVTWPFKAAGFQLQAASQIASQTVWIPIRVSPEPNNFELTFPIDTTGRELFRLVR